MIYILGDYYMTEDSDLADVVKITSTKIEYIFEYLEDIKPGCLGHYAILIKPENDATQYATIDPDSTNAYHVLEEYPPQFLTDEENKEEYEQIKTLVFHWCNTLREKKQRELEAMKRLNAERQEKQERELYEKLKAKYGD